MSVKITSKAAHAKQFKTLSAIEVKDIYMPSDMPPETDLGSPGLSPFTRGVHPTMYTGKLWTMRQYAGFGTAEETNKRYKFLLKGGQTGLSVAFDLPTQNGYDSDHDMSLGEVGKCGVAVSSLEDMETLFADIPLDKVSVSMTINASCAVILGMYLVLAERKGIKPEFLNGTVQNDILKEYIARGAYIYPPGPSMRLVVDTIEYCMKNVPRWNYISVSGYHIREAGATAIQEIAFTLTNGIAYVEACNGRGLDINQIGNRLSFFFNAHNDLLEEVAKFRAARRLWAKIMKERFGATDPRAMMLRFHTQTAGCSLTAQQPDNNVTRVALQAMAAVLGGTQSLHTNSRDEALALPTEKSAKIALRTQQLVAYESGVTKAVDPLGGSYYIEHLTSQLAKQGEAYIRRIDEMGGALKAVENGFYQKEISLSAYQYQKQVENRERIVVGVNDFTDETTDKKARLKILKVNQAMQKKQITKLAQYKKRRNNKKIESYLDALKSSAKGSDNLMPLIIEAIKAEATLGEICGTLREIFGEHKGASIF
ncbi:MAG: methylmalonyl-CoA mutase family protein [Planctomycetes bacterium]|nr:methylmalonyl-CoA mutase family protein [Planctomycetota bacterium]